MYGLRYHEIIVCNESHLVVVGHLTLLLVDGVVAGVALRNILDVALGVVFGRVLGLVHRPTLLLVRRLALLHVHSVIDGVVHRLKNDSRAKGASISCDAYGTVQGHANQMYGT